MGQMEALRRRLLPYDVLMSARNAKTFFATVNRVDVCITSSFQLSINAI